MSFWEIQRAIQKMVNVLHLFHTSLHDFNMIYVDKKKINHIIYNNKSNAYYFDSDNYPDIEKEDLDEINVPYQRFLNDKYYSFFTEEQVADIIDNIDDDSVRGMNDYLTEHPDQVYRLSGYVNGYATDIASAKRIARQEDLEITIADGYILDDGDGQPYGQARGYPYRELLRYRDTDMFDIISESEA